MCGLKVLQAVGITVASFMLIVSMGTEGFYAWKVYEVDRCDLPENATEKYDPCTYDRNSSDVCYYSDLEVRSYVGLAEGIVGTVAAVCFIIGLAVVNLALIWTWAVWALGISCYNAYCIYDYYTAITENMGDCLDESDFWTTVVDQDYGYFFVTVLTSLCCHVFALLVEVPVASILTHMVRPGSASMGSYELQERKHG